MLCEARKPKNNLIPSQSLSSGTATSADLKKKNKNIKTKNTKKITKKTIKIKLN